MPLIEALTNLAARYKVPRPRPGFRHLPWVLERDGLYYVLSGHHHSRGAICARATELRVEAIEATA